MVWIATPESSNIAGFEYLEDRRVLVVEFKSGGRYNYFDVPDVVYERFRAASSKGRFHAQQIKGIYRYARV